MRSLVIAMTAAAAVIPAVGAAQAGRPRPAVRFDPSVAVVVEYDNNVFLLSSAKRDALSDPTAADESSRRFANMESAGDIVARVGARLGIRARRTGLTVSPGAEYEYYARNPERRHAALGLDVEKDFPRGREVRLGIRHTPSYFAKNYLAGATDANGDRVIGPGERVYAPGRYSDTDAEARASFRVRAPVRARASLGLGYYTRGYDAPFENRDVRGPTVAASVQFGGRRAVELSYDGEFLRTDAGSEVIVVDERAVGRDLNANGRADDANVRALSPVDRSRNEHELRAGVRYDLRRAALRLAYALRLRTFSSAEELDVRHRGRSDRRHELRGDYTARIVRGAHLLAGARYSRQSTNRDGGADDDEFEDYSRARAYAGLRFDF